MTLSRRFGLATLVALLFSVYTLTHSSKFHIVDEVSLFAVTESLVLRGEVDTNVVAWTQWVNSPGEVLGAFGPTGEVFSKKGPAPAFLVVPWYLLLWLLAKLNITLGLLQGTLLWNGVLTALTAGLLWLSAVRLGYGDAVGALLGVLFGLCTIAWPYANQFFGEPLSGLCLLGCFYTIVTWRQTQRVGWMILAGIAAGMAIATVTAHVVLIAVFGVYIVASGINMRMERSGSGELLSQRQLVISFVAFVIPVAVAGMLLLWYNGVRFSNVLETGYHFSSGEGFTTPLFEGAYGLILSPYRGVFWHTPLLIVSLVGFVPFLRRHGLEGIAIGALSIVLIVLYGLWWMWWGGFAWGPRFLVPMTALWVLLVAPIGERLLEALRSDIANKGHPRPEGSREGPRRWSMRERLAHISVSGWFLILIAVISFAVQVLAVSVNFVNYEILLRSRYPTDWEDPLEFGPPAQEFMDFFQSPVFGQIELIRVDFAANTDLAWFWSDGNVQILVALVGAAVLVTLAALFVRWWYAEIVDDGSRSVPSRPVWLLVPVLPVLLAGVWLGEVSRNPHYGEPERGYRAILDEVCERARPSDALVTVAPFAYQISMNWMGAQCERGMSTYGYAANSMEHSEAEQVMKTALGKYERIWLVTGGLPANDPENSVERWLADHAYKANDIWFDDFRLLDYATPAMMNDAATINELDVPLVGDGTTIITVEAAKVPETIQAGKVLPVEILYTVSPPNDDDLRWFVQLLDTDGVPVVLLDTSPNDGYSPLSSLPAGETLVEKVGLQLADELPSGDYQLIAGLYNPADTNAARLRAPGGSDFVQLSIVRVE